jgi:hypothetical protein
VGPDADAAEHMHLGKSFEVFWFDIEYAPFVNFTWCNGPGFNEFAQPGCGFGIELVVVIHLMRANPMDLSQSM